jgi:hypothetical protein
MNVPLGEGYLDALSVKSVINLLADITADDPSRDFATKIDPKIDIKDKRAIAKVFEDDFRRWRFQYLNMSVNDAHNDLFNLIN